MSPHVLMFIVLTNEDVWRLVIILIKRFSQLYLKSGEESEAVVYPGVVEAVVGSLHAAKVDGISASENVAGMRGCVTSDGNSCVTGFG